MFIGNATMMPYVGMTKVFPNVVVLGQWTFQDNENTHSAKTELELD